MSRIIKSIIFFIFAVLSTASSNSYGEEVAIGSGEIFRAKIGIKITSQGKNRLAKSQNKILANDNFVIYVTPKLDSYIYVVHSDLNTAELMEPNRSKHPTTKDATNIYPNKNKSAYSFDGGVDLEKIIVISSPKILDAFTIFNEGSVSHEKWIKLEKELIEKSNLFGDDISKPEDSGGYIETGIKLRGTKSVISKIPTRSGKNFVVKRFDFHVEK